MDASRVVLGCGNFGGVGSDLSLVGRGEAHEEAFALMDAAWERGVRAFDTASSYGGGESERTIGRWIASRRPEGLVLTSKVFHPTYTGDDSGLAPARIRRVVRTSLEQLGVDRIDRYLIHEPDSHTPLADSLVAMDELVREGVIGGVGVSNVEGGYVEQAIGLTRIDTVQNEYSLLARQPERNVLQLCAEHGIRFEVFSPLAGGWLTGKYRRDAPFPQGSRMTLRPDVYEDLVRPEVYDAVDALRRRGDPATLALAWLFASPLVDAVVVGPRSPAQLDTVWAALELDIDRDELTELFTWSS